MCENANSSRNWTAGCGESYLSGAGSAGRNSTAESQHGRRPSTPWAQRQEELLRDCIVFPDVFNPMVDRLRAFVVPYQQALETEAGQRNVHLYLQGLLSHLPRKNAEDIAALVHVERQVIQDFIGIAPWVHRPLVTVLVGQVVERLGEPDGIIAFGRVPETCGYCLEASPVPSVLCPSAGRQASNQIFSLSLSPPCLV